LTHILVPLREYIRRPVRAVFVYLNGFGHFRSLNLCGDTVVQATWQMNRWIALVDMDAFFASVEQFRNHPEIAGKPVCVGHDPKGGKGRGVVRAASYEARSYGIRSGMPVSKAYHLCPTAVFIPGEFESYLRASDEIMEVLRGYADGERVRRASIDEAYIELTTQVEQSDGPESMCREIQRAVKKATNLPCSIGLAPNMSVAKVACGMRKPNGVTVVPQEPERVRAFLAPLDVDKLHGVGPKTTQHLRDNGIETVGQIQEMSVADLWPIMGRGSVWIHDRACGVDERPLLDNGLRVRQSISKDWTFSEDVDPDAADFMVSAITRMCERIGEKVQSKNMSFKTVTLRLRYDDFTTIQKSRSTPVETSSGDLLKRLALGLFEDHRDKQRPVRLLGVKVSGLVENGGQSTLCDFV